MPEQTRKESKDALQYDITHSIVLGRDVMLTLEDTIDGIAEAFSSEELQIVAARLMVMADNKITDIGIIDEDSAEGSRHSDGEIDKIEGGEDN